MRRVIPFLLAILVLFSPGETPPALGQDAEPAAPPPGWVSLGPIGPFPTTVIGVSPRWPADPFILTASETDLARSPDGGASWERLALPLGSAGQRPVSLGLASIEPRQLVGRIGPNDVEVWFLLARGRAVSPRYVFRSLDRGQTWTESLTLHRALYDTELAFSPQFAADGTVFHVGGGQLQRSLDAGTTWAEVVPQPGEDVQQLVVSPAFGADRTIFARVAPANAIGADRNGTLVTSTVNTVSAGIVVSYDAGDSWAPASAGLEVGGVPFHHVQDLAISPTFATDRSLLAVAWGPPGAPDARPTSPRYIPAHIFGSDDGGVTWEDRFEITWPAQLERTKAGPVNLLSGLLTLSPQFASDGVALFGLDSRYATTGVEGCPILRTADRGRTWVVVAAHTSGAWEECRRPSFQTAGSAQSVLMHRPREKSPGWWESSNSGQSWTAIETPEQSGKADGAWTVAADGTMLVAGTRGAWARGAGVRQTAGSITCPSEIGPTFRAPWDGTSAGVRAQLGCPTTPEHVVSVEERISPASPSSADKSELIREYRTDDGSAWRIEVIGTATYTRLAWRRPRDERLRVQAQEPRIVQGVVQWTDHGAYLRLQRWDGKVVTIITGPGDGDEREDGQPSLHYGR